MEVTGEDVAFLQYTGGTTGVSKGAVLTHRNMVANTLQVVAFMPELGEVDDPAVITALPLYHIFALTTNMLVFTHVGGNNVLITNPRDMPGFVKELAQVRFTFITGVNTLFNALLHTPGFDKLDFSSLKVALGGGMAVQAAVSERWRKVTGRHICQGWGLTESSPVGTANLPREAEFSGSIGYPIPSTEISICDDDGNALPNGSIGEICIRGPQVMRGYWNRPEETAQVMLPGAWLRTGDIGRMDARGRTFIEDRKKDMILVSGFNVYPNEVEGVVAADPGRARSRGGRAGGREVGRGRCALHREEGPGADGRRRDRALQARADAVQDPEVHLFPQRAAEDERREDPAADAAGRAAAQVAASLTQGDVPLDPKDRRSR